MQVLEQGGLAFRSVSAGTTHTCGVTVENAAYCWGANPNGQLGIGTNTGPENCHNDPQTFWACSTHPVLVVRGLTFRDVSAGSDHSCGVTFENVAYCWGSNSDGQLGIGSTTGPQRCFVFRSELTDPCSTRPVPVAGGLAFSSVSAGRGHSCGVTVQKLAYCWATRARAWGRSCVPWTPRPSPPESPGCVGPRASPTLFVGRRS